jgi:hypothetical protein
MMPGVHIRQLTGPFDSPVDLSVNPLPSGCDSNLKRIACVCRKSSLPELNAHQSSHENAPYRNHPDSLEHKPMNFIVTFRKVNGIDEPIANPHTK